MKSKQKNLLLGLVAIVIIAFFVFPFLSSDMEHIEDTNGPDNYALTTITDQDLVDHDMWYMGVSKQTNSLNQTVKFHSSKFSGVYEVMWTDILFSTDVTFNNMDFEVNEGNFTMAVVHDGEIIRVIEPGEDWITLGSLEGRISLVIAGESADFSFRLFESDYNSYSHID